jgi:hypothetical protein
MVGEAMNTQVVLTQQEHESIMRDVAIYRAAATLADYVRNMPVGYDLRHYEDGWYVEDRKRDRRSKTCATPEEALRDIGVSCYAGIIPVGGI